MTEDVLSRVGDHYGLLAVVVTVILLTVAEFGYRRGLRLHATADDPRRSQISAVQGAVLGMVGLLLGFTFSMAVGRYDSRRALVVQESNTIETTWLRGGMLPDAHRQAVRDLLRDYVDIRIASRQTRLDEMAERLRRSAEIQSKLWQHAEAVAREAPNDITALFVGSLNDMIDTDAARIAAGRSRIPGGVWLIVIVVAAVACWTSTYASGAGGVRSPLTGVMLPLLVSVVILLISDVANERRGIISVSQQPLIDLQTSIRSRQTR